MIQALDRRLIVPVLVALVLGLVVLSVVAGAGDDPASLWSKRGLIVLAVNGLILLLSIRPVFRVFHFITGARFWWFPWLDGEWQAEIRSNWPRVERMFEAARRGERFDALHDAVPADAPGAVTKARVTIRSSLLTMSVVLKPVGSSRVSKTIFVRPSWCKPSDPVLTYVYEQFDPKFVAATDAKRHLGASQLSYDEETDTLTGEYWTQRRGEQGFNTAGTIILRREKKRAQSRR